MRHHVVIAAEIVDLGLPDFCRHRPSGNEEDGGTGAALQVVQLDAVAGGEEFALHRSGRVKQRVAEARWTEEAKHNGSCAHVYLPYLMSRGIEHMESTD